MLDAFADGSKRADFVMSSQDNVIEMIEIKKPAHSLEDAEMTRINTYVDLMEEFLNQPGNKEFRDLFSKFHVTLVCDGLSLKGVYKTAFDAMVARGLLSHVNWRTFLLRTRKMHEEFLNLAERQRKDAAKE